MNWDKLDDTTRRFHSEVFDFPDVDVYNFDDGYDPETGKEQWTEVHEGSFPIEMVAPSEARMTSGPEGQETRIDFRAFARDDAGFDVYEVDDENSRPTEIEHQGDRYLVSESFDEGNGVLRMLLIMV